MAVRKPDGVINVAVYVSEGGLVFESRTESHPALKNNKSADDFYRHLAKAVRDWVDNQEGPDLPIPDAPKMDGFGKRMKKKAAERLVR